MSTPPHFYRLEVLSGGLGWLTENQRLFWAQRNQRVRGWRWAAYVWAKRYGLPHLDHARIVCELRFSDTRRRDPGNWAPTAKACVDGLVDAGVFDDDDDKHVIGPDMRLGPVVEPKLRGVHLLIYPLDKETVP
jgi:crossover junction endodeoxyribonuclease RusA